MAGVRFSFTPCASTIARLMDRLTFRNFRSGVALVCFLGTALFGFAADQWSKRAAVTALADGRTIQFIPGWIEFQYTSNHGAVFGIGQGQRALFITVSLAAVLFIFYLFATSGRQRGYQLVLGMLMAGVLGNLYDRLQYGYVRDMIHALTNWPNLFPWIFNIADTLLCVGVGLMIVYSFFHDPAKSAARPGVTLQSGDAR